MTNAIVKQTPISNIDDLSRVAKMLAISNYFDAKGDSNVAIAQIATKIMAGQEMGYGPFASVQGIHVIQGRPTLSANIMAAAVKAHPKYDYRVRKMSDAEVVIEFFEGEESLGTSSFTIEEARKAQTKNMDKFPRNMLFARAMSNGVRWYCPDVFNGNTVYTPEEFDVTVDASPHIINETTASKPIDKATGEIFVASPKSPNGENQALADAVGATVTVITDNPQEERAADKLAIREWEDAVESSGMDVAHEAANIANGFSSPADAQKWAVESKYCTNDHHARNRWTNIVKEKFNGKVDRVNVKAAIIAYVVDCLSKQAETA